MTGFLLLICKFKFYIIKKVYYRLWYSGWFLLSNEIEDCVLYLDNKLIYDMQIKSFNSSWCYYSPQSSEWLEDPCNFK